VEVLVMGALLVLSIGLAIAMALPILSLILALMTRGVPRPQPVVVTSPGYETPGSRYAAPAA